MPLQVFRRALIRRGLEADLPALAVGEFGFCTDSHKVFIGSDAGNIQIALGTGGFVSFGTPGSPLVVNPAVSLAVSSDPLQTRYLVSTGGAVPETAVPQIAAGTIGRLLVLKGTSSVDYPIFHDGDGLALNGSILLKNNASITLQYNGSVWAEDGRS